MPDVDGVVQRHAPTFHRVEVLGERLEVPRDPGGERRDVHVLDVLERVGEQIAVLGSARRDAEAAVPGDDRGDAVPRRRREGRIPEHLGVVVGVDVDEAGCDDEAAGIELVAARQTRPDLRDHTVAHRDVGDAPGSARAVDDRPAPDHHVLGHLLPLASHRTVGTMLPWSKVARPWVSASAGVPR